MNPFFILLFSVFVYCCSYSQTTVVEGRSVLGQGLWSDNVAGTTASSFSSFGLAYKNHFGISELAKTELRFSLPSKYAVFSTFWNNVGDDVFNQNEWVFSLARYFSSSFSMGISGRYHLITVQQKHSGSFMTDIGMQSKITQSLSIGALLKNPFRNVAKPTSIDLGVLFSASKKVYFVFSAKKANALPTSLSVQLNYYPTKSILLQSIVSTESSNNAFGMAYLWKSFSVDAFLSYHSYLGFSHQLSLNYVIN